MRPCNQGLAALATYRAPPEPNVQSLSPGSRSSWASRRVACPDLQDLRQQVRRPRQRRRKQPRRKDGSPLSGAELLGGAPVGGDEPEVGVAQLAANRLRGGMNGRRGRSLGLEGTALWTLARMAAGLRLDPLRSRRSVAYSSISSTLAAVRCCRPLRRQVPSSREGRKLLGFAGRILVGAGVLSEATVVLRVSLYWHSSRKVAYTTALCIDENAPSR